VARFDLTDEEWAVVAPLLPIKPRGVARLTAGGRIGRRSRCGHH
jgi:transposase